MWQGVYFVPCADLVCCAWDLRIWKNGPTNCRQFYLSFRVLLHMNATRKAMIQGRSFEFRKTCKQTPVSTYYQQSNPFQNFLRTDQRKHNCLAHATDYMWESTKTTQKARSRFRIHWLDWVLLAVFWHPTRINMSYKLNVSVCHIKHKNHV